MIGKMKRLHKLTDSVIYRTPSAAFPSPQMTRPISEGRLIDWRR